MLSEKTSKLVARLFIAGFEPGTSAESDLFSLIHEGLGGVILFSRNLPDMETILDQNRRLVAAAGARALVICLDQEGGRVQRLGAPFLQLPPMRALGQSTDAGLCHQAGLQLGRELVAAGFGMDFAPVLDVDTNPANPVIGDRAFSSDPTLVARLGVAFGAGLQEAGVAAVAKHFPGHGDTLVNSHLGLPVVEHDLARLREVELPPFAEAVRQGLSAIMLAHLQVPALDEKMPTSLSESVYRLARDELHFEGLLISDDLEMKAVAEDPGVVPAALAAIRAGADGVLICHRPELAARAIDKTVRAVERGEISLAALEAANRRWDELEAHFALGKLRPDRGRLEALFKSSERQSLERRLASLMEI
ncbi:MAG TPA: beta-N-acetylhexosaminidase [Myxococcota bacterium]|nr:beta-N-acetylhexosaminidase [Myxococcota bacterium]